MGAADTFDSPNQALAILRGHPDIGDLLQDQVPLATLWQDDGDNQVYVALTTSHLFVAAGSHHQLNDVHIFPDIINRELSFTNNVLQVHGPDGVLLEGTEPDDAHRIMAVHRLLRLDAQDPLTDLPPTVTFLDVHPIEYYEATLGPNSRLQVAEQHFGAYRVVLSAQTTTKAGHFIIQVMDADNHEVDIGIPTFRSPNALLPTSVTRPATIRVFTSAPSTEVLETFGITRDPAAPSLANMYWRTTRHSPFSVLREVLTSLQIPLDGSRGDVVHVQDPHFDRLAVADRTFLFNREGDPLELVHTVRDP